MAGRHSKDEGVLGGNAVAGVLAVLLVGGVGFGGYKVLSGGSEEGVAAPSAPSSVESSADASPASSTTPAATTASEQPSATATAPEPALPAGCRTQVDAGKKVISAADQAYRDWKGHTQADVDYRSGKISWTRTQAIWKDTRSRGDKDVSAFTSANGTYVGSGGAGCSTVDRGSANNDVKKCLDRFAAMENAIGKGRKVTTDWGAHVQMMKRKDHTNPNVYSKEWRAMVDKAPPNQNAYRDARLAYEKSPACSV